MGKQRIADRRLQEFRKLRKYFRDGFAPWTAVDGRLGFLTTRGANSPLDCEVGAREFTALLRDRFETELKYEATSALAEREPHESARSVLRRAMSTRAFWLLGALLGASFTMPQVAASVLILMTSAYFLIIAAVRIALAAITQRGARSETCVHLDDDELPVVTILAPLFREAHALPGLAQAIARLNYPEHKLDVKLLLEERDRDTLAEARRLGLDERFDLVIIPESQPQTKPKACNYGLHSARGDLIVIYDAEDEPEPDQLRIAAEIFAAGEDALACVQARLNFYNADENWLTRLFTLEYCLWFDHFLPALDRLGAPVPLGGTSNIFRTDVLADVGGWDPHNVTEDADLGLRLARRGYRTAVVSSTTYEEANCRIGNWMRQRSRWMKGFMQTWLVHRRNRRGAPLDWRTVISVDLFVGGTAFAALINPLLWAILAAERLAGFAPLTGLPETVKTLNFAALAAGNLAFLALAAFAPLRRGLGRISAAALVTPIYWMMMSIAAWRALIQLATRPSFWEKTDHGLSGEAKARRAAALSLFGLEEDAAHRQFPAADDDAQRRRESRTEAPTE
ncbi:MAG: glycosyltransferase family 2 protein [Pseudomonadota bacterium]